MRKLLVFSVMMLAVTGFCQAQTTVSFTVDFDVTTAMSGGAFASTYVPTADKFITYDHGDGLISVCNATTSPGAEEGTLNNGVAPSPLGNLGFFAVA
jgi:hypothetical protein